MLQVGLAVGPPIFSKELLKDKKDSAFLLKHNFLNHHPNSRDSKPKSL